MVSVYVMCVMVMQCTVLYREMCVMVMECTVLYREMCYLVNRSCHTAVCAV